MAEKLSPENETQLLDFVNWALAEKKTTAIEGYGSKAGFGFENRTDFIVSMKQFSGILEYEPTELIMRARAGTPLDEINRTLAANGQQLAFEPPQLSKLYFEGDNPGTIGGVFMGNLSGPRRFTAGAARDHILGIQAVNGRGESYKSGGKVIKNVTGYDMSKLLAGSWGTLSIVTEVTFKVLPKAETTNTIGIWGQTPDEAFECLRHLAQSPYKISGLAFIPEHVVPKLKLDKELGHHNSLTLIRLEGSPVSIRERIEHIKDRVPYEGLQVIYEEDVSLLIWEALRDVVPFHDFKQTPAILKLSVPPASMLDLVRVIEQIGGCDWYADAAGAWVWVGICHGSPEDKINTLRREIASITGSAVLYRATEAVKKNAGIYSGRSAAMTSLTKRVKQSFDPKNILNPGRLYLS